MRINKAIAIISAVVICLFTVSCRKDNTIMYNNSTMGNYVDGEYISDQGNIFNIVSQNCEGRIDTMSRALTVCDILNKTAGGRENEYDVRMNLMMKILVKDIVTDVEGADEEVKVEHPINIENIWISGGYINLAITFAYNPQNKTKHLINLLQQESNEEGTYSFRLTHNAFEDAIKDNDTTGHEIAGSYVSFPINTLLKEDEVTLKISWIGFQPMDLATTEEIAIEGTYKKDGFEHAPLTTLNTKAAIR